MSAGEPSEVPTPLSDEYAARPKAMFSNVLGWARSMERRAVALRAQLRAVDPELGALVIEKAVSQLDGFLQPGVGRLARALARPPAQLSAESTARRLVESAMEKLLAQGETALGMANELAILEREIAIDRDRFRALLPNVTGSLLDRALLQEQHVRAIRTRDGIRRARRRHAIVRETLLRYEVAALTWSTRTKDVEVVNGAILTIDELHALVTFSRDERKKAATQRDTGVLVRDLASAQLNILSSLAKHIDATTESSALERLLARGDTFTSYGTMARGDEAIVSAGALGAATRAGAQLSTRRKGAPNQFRWKPVPRSVAVSEGTRDDAVEWNVISLADGIVCLSRDDDSPLRLFNAGRELGTEKDVVIKMDARLGPENIGRKDLESLNDMTDTRAGWYTQTSRTRIRLIATDGDLWFGELVKKGVLTRRDGNGASARAPQGLTMKLLGPQRDWNMLPLEQDIIFEGTPVRFGAIRRQGARSGLQNAELLVAHCVDDSTNEVAASALKRERALFEALEAQVGSVGGPLAAIATTFIGIGKAAKLEPCPLYRAFPYLEVRDDAATAWLRVSDQATFSAIRSIAEIFQWVWQSNWTLGVCTPMMFGFSLRWDPDSGLPLPTARLIAAPFATPVGAQFLKQCSQAEFVSTRHERIDITVFSSRIPRGEAAAIGTDMLAMLSLCFELLAKAKIDYGEGNLATWAGIGRVANDGHQFRCSRFVAVAAIMATNQEGREKIFKMFRAMVAGTLISFAACEQYLMSSGESDEPQRLVLRTSQ